MRACALHGCLMGFICLGFTCLLGFIIWWRRLLSCFDELICVSSACGAAHLLLFGMPCFEVNENDNQFTSAVCVNILPRIECLFNVASCLIPTPRLDTSGYTPHFAL